MFPSTKPQIHQSLFCPASTQTWQAASSLSARPVCLKRAGEPPGGGEMDEAGITFSTPAHRSAAPSPAVGRLSRWQGLPPSPRPLLPAPPQPQPGPGSRSAGAHEPVPADLETQRLRRGHVQR